MNILIEPCTSEELGRAREVWPDDVVTNVWSESDEQLMDNWLETVPPNSSLTMAGAPGIYIRRFRANETTRIGMDLLVTPKIGVKFILAMIDFDVSYEDAIELTITAPSAYLYGSLQPYPFHDVPTTQYLQPDGQLDWHRIRALIEERQRVLVQDPEHRW